MNNSTLTIRKPLLHENVLHIKEHLSQNTEILAVVKSNAYGLGLAEIAETLDSEPHIYGFGIAHVSEGITLREHGIKKPIILLSGIEEDGIALCINYNIQILLHNLKTLQWLDNYHQIHPETMCTVNLKINTCFNRFGFKVGNELHEILMHLKDRPWIIIHSSYSHPIEGEIVNSTLTQTQHTLYLKAINQIKTAGIDPGKLHFCNSGASEWFTEGHHDLVRLGRRLYIDSVNEAYISGIKEPMTWTAQILEIKHLEVNESSGYNQTFIAKKPTDIAIINVGYGDGLILYKTSKHMPILINGKHGHVVAVCMDTAVVDITGIDCEIGDDAILFGEKDGTELTSREVAAVINDEGCSITTLISNRVARKYLDE